MHFSLRLIACEQKKMVRTSICTDGELNPFSLLQHFLSIHTGLKTAELPSFFLTDGWFNLSRISLPETYRSKVEL